MKVKYPHYIAIIFIVFISVNLFTRSTLASSKETSSNAYRPKIAVISHSDFLPDRTQIQRNVSGLPDILAQRIIEFLIKSKRFVPVERTALRKVVLEQRFGQDLRKSYLDRTLDKAIESMEKIPGAHRVSGVETEVVIGGSLGQIGAELKVKSQSPIEPKPVGSGIKEAEGSIGTTGALANYNDILKDFQDLGTAVEADFLVVGNIEKLSHTTKEIKVPYSESNRKVRQNMVDARLRLRVIDVKSGTVFGAKSLRTQTEENVFEGKEIDTDKYSFYDHLGRLAAVRILDIIFPARVINVDPIVISRGTNDGVSTGDLYIVEREGKELKDKSGIVIARLKQEIGLVKIVKIQDTVSIANPVSGQGFAEGDLASLNIEATKSPGQLQSHPVTQPIVSLKKQGKRVLPRVAIGLIKSGSTARTGKKADEHTPIFTDTIISRLAQTKRFQMIDRQEADQLINEQLAQAIAKGQDLPSAMGTLKGSDYLVYGSLASFGVEDKEVRLPNSKKTFKSKIGYVEGNMRVVDARSGDIVESRKISVQEPVEVGAKGSRVVTALADAYAEQVVLILMNAIYPIKVAAVGSDGTIYINRGDDGGLYAGEILDAFMPGKPIIDPDTGVQLGVEEIRIGKVVINSVENARSKGGIIEGSRLAKGDILRRTIKNKGKRSMQVIRPKPSRSGLKLPGTGMTASKKEIQTKAAKATIAVGMIKLNPNARTSHFGKGHLKRLTDELIVKLTHTNRFLLMEREEIDQVLDEKAFETTAEGGDIQNRLKELISADYLVHGEITNFYTSSTRQKVAYLNETQTDIKGVAEGALRIIDVHNGSIIAADKVSVYKKVRQTDDDIQIISDLIDRFTTQAVSKILDRIYPIKLLGISGDNLVYINRGLDADLKIGSILTVLRPGEELKDPDTGLSFGRSEIKIGQVKIVAVEAFRAKAKMISGHDAQAGDILRKSQKAAKRSKRKKKLIRPQW